MGLVMENKKYIDKVIGSLLRGSKVDNEKKLISFPWLPFPLGIETELKSYFDSKDPYNSRPNFHNYCKSQFGLSSDEMKFVHDKLNFIFKDKLKNLYDLPISRFNRLNESIENKRYLNKVLEYLVKGTKIEITVGYNFEGIFVYMPFDVNPPEFINVNDHRITTEYFSALPSFMFNKYCVNHFGLVEEEIKYVWDEYSEIMSKKFKSELRKI